MNWSGSSILCLVVAVAICMTIGYVILGTFNVQQWFVRSLVVGLSAAIGVTLGQYAHRRFFPAG